MHRWSTRLLTLVLALILVGCAAHKHREAGDAAVAAGDMHGAVYHYQRAMGLDESLARSETFMAKLAVAEARVAYDKAVQLRERGDYEQAIEQLRLALQRDPAYEAPQALMPLVQAEASRVRYVRAVESADAGDLGQARLHLERALQHDMRNERAAFALTTLAPERLPADTPGLANYDKGMSLTSDRRWPEAEAVLRRAIAEGPGLLPARSGLHYAQKQLDRSRRYAAQGAKSVNERQIGPAIDALTLSLDIWPYNDDARKTLARARERLAEADQKLAAATDAAAQRQWEQAIALAQSGLAIDASHAGLNQSLRTYRGKAAADYEDQGDALRAGKDLIEAEKAYARAVELDPALRSARSSLQDTQSRLQRARSLTSAGQGHIQTLQMAGAISVLTQSLEIWPFNEQGKTLLGHAREQQRRAGEHHSAAMEAAKVNAWDAAIELADEALALDRSYAGLTELRRNLPFRAAADYTQRGADQLTAGQLDDAQSSYAKALSYADAYEQALNGMASVYAARGAQLEAKGQLGAALLQYAKGRDIQPKHRISESLARATAAVRSRVGMGLSVAVDPGRGGAVGPDQVGQSLSSVLARYRSQGLRVNAKGSPYIMDVTIGEATINERRVGSSSYSHDYTITELRHNDAYDRIVDCLKHEERLLHDRKCAYDDILHERAIALRKAERLRPPAAPTPPTQPTQQPGQDDAQHNQAQQRYEEAKRHYERELAAHKHKQAEFSRALSYYKGLGKKKDRVYSALCSQERTVKDLRRQLSRTPHQIKVIVPQQWPYTVETHEKRGRLAVTTQIIESATGKVIDQFDHAASFADRDDLLLNARPDIGLREDRLRLVSDARVRDSLTTELAANASPRAVNAAVQHRLNLINQRIEQLRAGGETDAAIEAEVDAALLLGIVDRNAAAKRIDDLARQHAR